jgi:hypothetical protein
VIVSQKEVQTNQKTGEPKIENSEEHAICRLCMNEDAAVNIFDALEENVAISDAITCCVPLIKVFIYSFIN